MRKTGLTGYVEIGTDIIRATAAWFEDGSARLVAANGSNATLDDIGARWRTSGDVVSTAATTGKSFNMAALNADDIPVHAQARTGRTASKRFKTSRTLRQMAVHMIGDASQAKLLCDALELYYAEEA
jgi:hypothetical protein